jgi:hypothetical protein
MTAHFRIWFQRADALESRMRHLFLLPALVCSLSAQEVPLAERVQAAQRLRVDALRQLQGELALETDPGKVYFEALVAYGIVAQTMSKDPKGAEALLDRTIDTLKLRKDPESQALHGSLLGLKIGFSSMSAMTLAPRASSLFSVARKAAPESPRVLLLQGIHVLHTPAFFGGGAKAAMPLLEAAVKAAELEQAPKDPWAPRWGKAESYAWLATAEMDLGLTKEANAHLDQSLSVDPAYGYAKFVLGPKLGRVASQGASQ